MAATPRTRVFISYSHEDREWFDRLYKTLTPMIRQRPQAVFWDGRIKAGAQWRQEIETALATTRVAVLLVSPGFLASEFILDVELPYLLDKAESEGVVVLWCQVRRSWYENTPLVDYQAVHDPSQAWNALSEPELDELLVRVAGVIQEALAAGVEPPPPGPPAADREPEPDDPVPADEAAGQVEALLDGIVELEQIHDVGALFVLRRRWTSAACVFDRLIDRATPRHPTWMAYGYERLGQVHRRRGHEERARECFQIGRSLYRLAGLPQRAADLGARLSEGRKGPVPPPAQ